MEYAKIYTFEFQNCCVILSRVICLHTTIFKRKYEIPKYVRPNSEYNKAMHFTHNDYNIECIMLK